MRRPLRHPCPHALGRAGSPSGDRDAHCYREHRRLSDLLLLTALATVGVTDFVFSALPALTGSEALGLGSGPQVACDALAAVAFAAAALVPSHRLDRAGTRALRIAAAAALSTILLASLVD